MLEYTVFVAGRVNDLVYAPDGKHLILAVEQSVLVLTLPTRNLLWHAWVGETAYNVACSPDGSQLAVASASGVSIWSITGQRLDFCDGHAGNVYSVTYIPVNALLVTAGADKMVLLWEWQRGRYRPCFAYRQHTEALREALATPVGERILSYTPFWLHVWQRATGKPLIVYGGPHDPKQSTPWLYRAQWSPDGTMIALAMENAVSLAVLTSDTSHCEELQIQGIWQGHEGRGGTIAFSSGGQMLATAGYDASIRTWCLPTGSKPSVSQWTSFPQPSVKLLAWSPDDTCLCGVTSAQGIDRIQFWRL